LSDKNPKYENREGKKLKKIDKRPTIAMNPPIALIHSAKSNNVITAPTTPTPTMIRCGVKVSRKFDLGFKLYLGFFVKYCLSTSKSVALNGSGLMNLKVV